MIKMQVRGQCPNTYMSQNIKPYQLKGLVQVLLSVRIHKTFKRTQFSLNLTWFSSTVVSLELIKQIFLPG